MKCFSRFFTVAVAVSSSLAFVVHAAEKPKPNIVFILADDMGYDSVAGLNPESGMLKTPNIDRLMDQGMYFTDGHSDSAVCTPSRYGILTGRYSWRTKLKRQVLWGYGMPLIEKDRLTMPAMLGKQGYYTGCIGKWHLGMEWHTKDGEIANKDLHLSDKIWTKNKAVLKRMNDCESSIDFTKPISGPVDRGFDYYFGMDLPNMAPYTWLENNRILKVPTVQKPKEIFGDDGLMCKDFKPDVILPKLSDRAYQWILDASKKKQPFFLYFAVTSPHTPVAPSKEFIGKSGLGKYGDFVYQTDWVVGHVMKAIDDAGIAENTIVIFSTDNGTAGNPFRKVDQKIAPNLGYHFRGSKLSIYEGGHRVPLIVRWPGKILPKSHSTQTVCLNDFMATFAELTGYQLPDNAAEDSFSMLPLLTGKAKTLPKHPGIINHDYAGSLAIRNGEWKLIAHKKPQLYNLDKDPKERKNLASQYPEKAQEMMRELKKAVQEGRSMPGSKQSNYNNQTTWPGLPWH